VPGSAPFGIVVAVQRFLINDIIVNHSERQRWQSAAECATRPAMLVLGSVLCNQQCLHEEQHVDGIKF
jgi:hypothetical protein